MTSHAKLLILLSSMFIFTCCLSGKGMAQYVVQEGGQLALPAEAETKTSSRTSVYQWHDKLKRGAINTITSIVEIPKHIHSRTESDSLLAGWTIGIVEGFGQGVVRFGAGVLDVLTFPFNFPKDKKAPLIDPEYVWQKSNIRYA